MIDRSHAFILWAAHSLLSRRQLAIAQLGLHKGFNAVEEELLEQLRRRIDSALRALVSLGSGDRCPIPLRSIYIWELLVPG